MYYVYLLRSIPNPDQTYIGYTENLKSRLQAHNHGQSRHTSKYKPWDLITYLSFNDKDIALSFEKYLKSHSGKAFANKRLIVLFNFGWSDGGWWDWFKMGFSVLDTLFVSKTKLLNHISRMDTARSRLKCIQDAVFCINYLIPNIKQQPALIINHRYVI